MIFEIYEPIVTSKTGCQFIVSSLLRGISDLEFKKWFFERMKNSKFYKRMLVLEKKENIIYNENAEVLNFLWFKKSL